MARLKALLSNLLLAPALIVLTDLPLQAQPAARAEIRGVWLTANDMPTLRDRPRMQAVVAQLAALRFNTLYMVVWNGGQTYYPSRVSEQRQLQDFSYRGIQGQDLLAELSDEAHRQGLLLIPWFEFGFMAPPDSALAKLHPSWLSQKRDGGRTSISAAGEVVWLNPFHPEVQQLIRELVLEVVSQYDADGIQFDDHMSLPREFGYDAYTSALYKKETGKAPPANPQEPGWVKWRADKLTAFMASLRQELQARKPAAIVSISPNYYDFAYKLQLQDWLSWVRRGIADEVVIQMYRPNLESFEPHLMRAEVREIQQSIPVAMGIMSGQRNHPAPMELIQAQVRASRQQGLGVAFFYLESLWDPNNDPSGSRLAGLQELFPDSAPRQRPLAAQRMAPPPPPPLDPPQGGNLMPPLLGP